MPTIHSERATLRALRPSDSGSLFSLLTTEAVGRFILPPPSSVERFGHFIDWTRRQEEAGRHLCFGIVPAGHDEAVGLIQVRRETPESTTAEWGFVLSERFWGTGLFEQSAALVMEFAFERVRVHRLEARCAAKNARGSKALLKVGAVPEGILRKAFLAGGEHLDQVLYAIVQHDWCTCRDRARAARLTLVH